MTLQAIIFDFDGTIADTFTALLNLANRLADELGYPVVDAERVEYLRHLSSRQILRQLGIPLWKLPMIIHRIKGELHQEMASLQPITGIPAVLAELKAKGFRLGIITSNLRDNVEVFLANQDLDMFDFIHTGATIFGKHHVIQQCLQQQHLHPSAALYVGDETRDVDAARQIQVRSVAVGWGFNAPPILLAHQPDFFIDQPAELLNLVDRLALNTTAG